MAVSFCNGVLYPRTMLPFKFLDILYIIYKQIVKHSL